MVRRICILLTFQYHHLKSDNLQRNTLVRWADGTNNSLTKCLMFQVFFFHIFLAKLFLKTVSIIIFFYNFLQNHQQTSKPAYHILVCQIYIHEFVLSSHGYFALAIAEKRETFWFNVDLSCKNLLEVQSSKKGSGWQESQTSKRKSGFRT